MFSRSADIVILGAGPAGMAAAMELSRAGKPVTVVEKASQVGGLAKTILIERPEGTYRTDIGPHRFYSKNRYLYDFIEDLLGEEWRRVPRQTRFLVDGVFYAYPIRLRNVLLQIGWIRAAKMGRDYLWERVRRFIRPRKMRSFEDYALAEFGQSLAEFNILHYTEKIWGLPCREISIDWAQQRIGGLSLWAALKRAMFPKGGKGPKTLVDSFYYPSLGSGTIYEAIKNRIAEGESEVWTESEPVKIRREGMRVTAVDVRKKDGTIVTFEPSSVINSIPLTRCIELFDPPAPDVVRDAASKLRFRSQVYLFLTVDRERVTNDNWIYFPDKSISFGRISEMKNFSVAMCPPGKTSLFVEFFCFEGDEVWNASKEELFDRAIATMETLGLLKREEVLSVHHYKLAHVYPLYDLHYGERLKTILSWLDEFENFYAVGRPGRFRYTNQDHSLEMGIIAAQCVITGQRRPIEVQDDEYFEQGYVPEAARLTSNA